MSRHELWLSTDNYKRQVFLKFEIKKRLLKSIKQSTVVPNYRRYWAYFFLLKYPRFSSKIVIRNRCSISGRAKGLTSRWGLSRFNLRTKVYRTDLPGFKRASW